MWPFLKKPEPSLLLQVQPSRWDEAPIQRAASLFRGLVGMQGCSLEFAAYQEKIGFYVRASVL